MPKPKSKRRSASSFFTPSASGVGKSVGAISGGAETSVASSAPVVEGVGGDNIDVVGGDDVGNIYIGHGGAVTKIEVCDGNGANPDCGGAEDSVFVGGEGSVISGGGEGMLGGGAGPSIDVVVGANLGAEGGEGEVKGEKEKGNIPSGGGDDSSVIGSNVSIDGASGGAEEVGGANIGGGEDVGAVNGGVNISPIPLIPRRRLREILAHAEGECIMLVYLLCVYRWWTLLCLLGDVLSLGEHSS